MRDKKTRAALIQWLVPSMVLLFIVVIMLIDFSVTSQNRVVEDLEEGIITVAESYAQKVYAELDMMTNAGVVAAEIFQKHPDDSKENLLLMAEVLNKNTYSQGVIVSDLLGKAVTHEGEELNISQESYFEERSDTKQKYIYVEDTSIFSQSSIVSEIPVYGEKELEGYIFLFYPLDRFADMIKKIEFDSRSFYAIVKEDGSIVNAVGGPSVFTEHNLLDALRNADIYKGNYEKIELKFSSASKGIAGANYKGESKMMAYTSIGIHNWHMVIGVNQSYIDKQITLELTTTIRIIRNLIIAIFVFFGLIIIINIINKIRFNAQSKCLEDRANTDLLTELNNKIATERKIKDFIEKNAGKQGLMFVLDIDNFKKINDTMGHAFGDEVLRTLGLQIRAEFRVSDIKGRVGGDEFILFFKDIEDDEAILKQAEKVAAFFRNFKAGEYVKYSATASIGVAIYSKDGNDFETLYKAADKALYKAKKRGKNQLAFYDDSYDVRRGIVDE